MINIIQFQHNLKLARYKYCSLKNNVRIFLYWIFEQTYFYVFAAVIQSCICINFSPEYTWKYRFCLVICSLYGLYDIEKWVQHKLIMEFCAVHYRMYITYSKFCLRPYSPHRPYSPRLTVSFLGYWSHESDVAIQFLRKFTYWPLMVTMKVNLGRLAHILAILEKSLISLCYFL